MNTHAHRALGSVVLLTAAFLLPKPAVAGDTCVQTRVEETFVAPDGQILQPGLVKVCPYWTISSAVRLSRIVLNGRTLGVWMSRAGEGGRFDDGTAVVLRRLPKGRVALANYYWPGDDGRPAAPGLRTVPTELAEEAVASAFTIE